MSNNDFIVNIFNLFIQLTAISFPIALLMNIVQKLVKIMQDFILGKDVR